MNQNEIFKGGEADCWYERNRISLSKLDPKNSDVSIETSELCLALDPFKSQINSILEIGCSSGLKLEAICNHLSSSGAGLDPSKLAVDEGNRRLDSENISLICGTSEKLPFSSCSFDVVYFGFCLYLFDRQTLMASLAEADRVLKSGGFLAITDFDPGIRTKRPYVHREGIFSYKQSYANFYVESGMYYLLEKRSFSHRQSFFDFDPDERVSLSVLYKEMNPYPVLTV